MNRTICLALTGASGMPYGLRLLECLLAAGCNVQLLYSQAAQIVARQEMDFDLPSRPAEAKTALLARLVAVDPEKLAVFGREEWFAPVASGSNPPDAMVVCPCSMGTLAAIAQGLADNLIERAAGKEQGVERKQRDFHVYRRRDRLFLGAGKAEPAHHAPQRCISVCGTASWSSTRATTKSTMSATLCGCW